TCHKWRVHGADGADWLLPCLCHGWSQVARRPAVIRVDAALFAAAQAGDPAALERMLRELQPDVRRYARRPGQRTSGLGDGVQEARIVVYRCLGNVRYPWALAGWIFRVVTRLCMLPWLGLIRGAEELTQRHEAEYFAQIPKHELRIDLARSIRSSCFGICAKYSASCRCVSSSAPRISPSQGSIHSRVTTRNIQPAKAQGLRTLPKRRYSTIRAS